MAPAVPSTSNKIEEENGVVDKLTLPAACSFLKNIGLPLRTHQIEGVETILNWYDKGHGGILADEMGLGKTCQAIVALAILSSSAADDEQENRKKKYRQQQSRPRSLIICPLTVLDHWENEIKRFSCNCLKVWRYYGSKEKREEMRRKHLKKANWDVLLTTFETFLQDRQSNLLHFDTWDFAIFDEAHRIKNDMSLLHQAVSASNIQWMLLMTGTPIQNNLPELYSLLKIVDANKFPEDKADEFVQKYREITKIANQFQVMFNEYCLRRSKKILEEVPKCSETILFHGISKLQYDLYKALLANNRDFLLERTSSLKAARQPLMSLLAQLRKCCDHPYLFRGLEPEPFTEGEHLVTASGKTAVLDRLLTYLAAKGHRVLVFSQMKTFLDIVHEILLMRGYNFEQLDGTTKMEDRFRAVENFQRPGSDVFAFLLTTKAGGVGLNLTGADTAIFLDWDFNPQNDKQAAARCHRIGQDKPVKIIRLVAKHTVEELIKYRAAKKLALSERVLGIDEQEGPTSKVDLANMLIEGLKELDEAQEKEADGGANVNGANKNNVSLAHLWTDQQLEQQIGHTERNGRWQIREEDQVSADHINIGKAEEDVEMGEEEETAVKSIYVFEGRDYSEDRQALDKIVRDTKTAKDEHAGNDLVSRVARSKAAPAGTADFDQLLISAVKRAPRPKLTDEEREERSRKRKELERQRREKAAQEREERKKRLWQANYYTSINLPLPEKKEENGQTAKMKAEEEEEVGKPAHPPPTGSIFNVVGDVTRPARAPGDSCPQALLLQSVDDGGHFGTGGVFTALRQLSTRVPAHYELAARMDDLHRGDSHLVEAVVEQSESAVLEELDPDEMDKYTEEEKDETIDRSISVALMVVQSVKDRYTRTISIPALQQCLQRVQHFCRTSQNGPVSVHLPQIWFDVQNLDEPQCRRLLDRHLCAHGINVYIYKYRRPHGAAGRHQVRARQPAPTTAAIQAQQHGATTSRKRRSPPAAAATSTFQLPARKRARIRTRPAEEEEEEEEEGMEESEEEEEDEYVPESESGPEEEDDDDEEEDDFVVEDEDETPFNSEQEEEEEEDFDEEKDIDTSRKKPKRTMMMKKKERNNTCSSKEGNGWKS